MELTPVQRRIRDFYFKEGLGAPPDVTHVHRPNLVPDQQLFSLEHLRRHLNDPLFDLDYVNLFQAGKPVDLSSAGLYKLVQKRKIRFVDRRVLQQHFERGAACVLEGLDILEPEMNALATVTVVDIYKRHVRPVGTDHHYLTVARAATVFWGAYAVVGASYAKGLGSLIEVVNVLGSLFYGGMLGVFVLAFFFRRVRARGAFYGVLAGEAAIFACWYYTSIAFLWYNVIGCLVVIGFGLAISMFERTAEDGAAELARDRV